jgi:hypothetical protein
LLPDGGPQDVPGGRAAAVSAHVGRLAELEVGADDREQEGVAEDPDVVVVDLGGLSRASSGRR